ncbi:MAG TPA: HAMP domain-containing sensor histidine kinase, partial [Acidimicrobiales bacterium]|nr:HAMP domain-containing sensor histidine kinase [Acidimicrobiales bacterium]
MTLRARLAVVVAGAVAAAIVVAVGVAWVATHHSLRSEIDDALSDRAVALAALPAVQDYVQRDLQGASRPGVPRRDVPGIRAALIQDLSIQLLTVDGRTLSLAGSPMPVRPVDRAIVSAGVGSAERNARVEGSHFRVVTQAVEGGGAVQVGRAVDGTDRTLRSLAVVLVTTALVGVLAAALLGLIVAKRALRPLDHLSDAAERVARDQDLTAPLPPATADDEVGRLTRSFNTMLAALATSRAQQQRLVHDASHELRTPLTSLRTTIELLRRADRSPDDDLPADQRTELYDHALDELDELTLLSSELVELATDARSGDEPVRPVALGEVAEAVAARARRRTGRQVVVAADSSAVSGRPAAIERAVSNLVDNAGKWSPPGTPIEVDVTDGVVRVRDHGPGIPLEDRDRVFERFARGRDAQSVPGSGLGLAIVRQVAVDHGGWAWIEEPEDGGPGTVVA